MHICMFMHFCFIHSNFLHGRSRCQSKVIHFAASLQYLSATSKKYVFIKKSQKKKKQNVLIIIFFFSLRFSWCCWPLSIQSLKLPAKKLLCCSLLLLNLLLLLLLHVQAVRLLAGNWVEGWLGRASYQVVGGMRAGYFYCHCYLKFPCCNAAVNWKDRYRAPSAFMLCKFDWKLCGTRSIPK